MRLDRQYGGQLAVSQDSSISRWVECRTIAMQDETRQYIFLSQPVKDLISVMVPFQLFPTAVSQPFSDIEHRLAPDRGGGSAWCTVRDAREARIGETELHIVFA